MNDSIWTIPLFPLETVLFPYTALPLHIFEPRYREMVMYCLETDSPFGIALVREGREAGDPHVVPHEIGTLARIGRLRRQPDGRFHLLALGEERFQIVRLIRHEAPYLKAHVRLWRDHEPFSWEQEQQFAEQTAAEFREFLRLALEASGLRVDDIELPHDPTALSFAIAGTLQLEMPMRQYLLELQDTSERLRLVRQIVQNLMTALSSDIQPFDPDHWREYVNRN
ncbi:MAG: LON peptidase substrate-binding domain-containing protein [Fimbriimonadales bacterium]|nr:LON peptidase substrate-binding domain-containing protein [Fimbriimonadales bacterium]